MLGLLLSLIGWIISVVFPLVKSYQSIVTNSKEGTVNWLIYWIIYSVNLYITSCGPFQLIFGYIPFFSLVRLYFHSWLVLPLIDVSKYNTLKENEVLASLLQNHMVNGGDKRVNGALLLWFLYLDPMLESGLQNLDLSSDNIWKQLQSLVVRLVQRYTSGAPKPSAAVPERQPSHASKFSPLLEFGKLAMLSESLLKYPLSLIDGEKTSNASSTVSSVAEFDIVNRDELEGESTSNNNSPKQDNWFWKSKSD
ncbi:BA75_05133T0 [Komagataella pastoris]|uniref:Protein YOP1 n=1 Tax=Komagataella pastoris TaxID=4922 RepID=A0A1B2JJ43_PICPA|nr:BA75_05133T0 [Komagataella pastoris]